MLSPQVIRMLTEKAKQQEALIIDLEEHEKELLEVEAEAALLRQQTESSREEMQSMGKEIEQLEDRIELMENEKKEILKNKERLERILAEAAYSMHRILTVSTLEYLSRFCRLSSDGSLSTEQFCFSRLKSLAKILSP